MSSEVIDKTMRYALVNTYDLADRCNGVQRERPDLVYFDMQGKGIHVARYSYFRVILVYNNSGGKDQVVST